MADNKAEQSQINKFRDLAREPEADEDPAHFEETLKKIATKTPPAPSGDDPKAG